MAPKAVPKKAQHPKPAEHEEASEAEEEEGGVSLDSCLLLNLTNFLKGGRGRGRGVSEPSLVICVNKANYC